MLSPMLRLSKIMELFWLLLGVLTLIAVLYLGATQGFQEFKIWFLFPAVAFAMYFFRRFMRRKMKELEDHQKNQ